jgi:hypothetical protein
MPTGLAVMLCAILFGLVVYFSWYIAEQASGERASGWWGVLGPVGWLIAAARGIQERLED